jgi:Holliday junction resolvase RusA-like endonuclease
MPIITFTIPGKPVAKARPRFTKEGRTYTPDNTANFETLAKLCFQQVKPLGFTALDEPVRVTIKAQFAMPKKAPKRVETRPKVTKPDIDNIIKSVLDGLNTVAWRDDSVVHSIISNKIETVGQECTVVHIAWGELL